MTSTGPDHVGVQLLPGELAVGAVLVGNEPHPGEHGYARAPPANAWPRWRTARNMGIPCRPKCLRLGWEAQVWLSPSLAVLVRRTVPWRLLLPLQIPATSPESWSDCRGIWRRDQVLLVEDRILGGYLSSRRSTRRGGPGIPDSSFGSASWNRDPEARPAQKGLPRGHMALPDLILVDRINFALAGQLFSVYFYNMRANRDQGFSHLNQLTQKNTPVIAVICRGDGM